MDSATTDDRHSRLNFSRVRAFFVAGSVVETAFGRPFRGSGGTPDLTLFRL